MLTNFTSKTIQHFYCEKCDFKCCKKGDYNRHILTSKHKMLTNVAGENINDNIKFKCVCGKEYNHRQSLSIHKKKCPKNEII